MILYCAADLIWASKIKATADALGIPARPVRTREMLDARLVDSPVRALIVDLDAPAALDLVDAIRADPTRAGLRVLAFGPHVATDLLASARQRGADTVMARGGFAARMPGLLKALSDSAIIPDDLND